MMTCSELEILICDYVDGALDTASRSVVEEHLVGCPACAELARDAAAAVSFMERAPAVEPPPELLTRILFETRHAPAVPELGRRGRGWLRQWLDSLLEPILQPRFAMGMAMTILSFSMLGRFAGVPVRQLRASDLHPAAVWETVSDKAHRGWDSVVKYYESLRFVYEVQSRLHELTAQDEQLQGSEEAPTPQNGNNASGNEQRQSSPAGSDQR